MNQSMKDNKELQKDVQDALKWEPLLKAEEIALQVHMRDRKCLNSNITAYIPKLRSDGNYGWISAAHVKAFKMYQDSSPVIKSERV